MSTNSLAELEHVMDLVWALADMMRPDMQDLTKEQEDQILLIDRTLRVVLGLPPKSEVE